jgi:6-pyruvoyltetrahydropterin/6-carboxytetrahydropterin synthase
METAEVCLGPLSQEMFMFALTVRDHIMVAHSFRGAVFGPAQKLHGATFIVDLELARSELDADGIVTDIGALTSLLREVLTPLNYKNLDEIPEFSGKNTTTEFLCREIYQRVRGRIVEGALGKESPRVFQSLKISLGESHVAWASFAGPV